MSHVLKNFKLTQLLNLVKFSNVFQNCRRITPSDRQTYYFFTVEIMFVSKAKSYAYIIRVKYFICL